VEDDTVPGATVRVALPVLFLLLAASADAGTVFFPGQDEFGTLLYEDQWPSRGDLDFNDAVVRFNARVDTLDATGEVSAILLTLPLEALGSTEVCGGGMGLRLPLPASTPMSATTSVSGGPPVLVPPDPIEPDAVLWLVDDLRAELCGGQEGLLNTDEAVPPVACDSLVVELLFQPPVAMDASDPPFDLFFHRCGDRTHQVHRSAYGGTAQADPSLYGTGDDASSPPDGPFYIDEDGIPFLISENKEGSWPRERVRVDQAFPEIANWAASGGTSDEDWYDHPDPDFIYLPEPRAAEGFAWGTLLLIALARAIGGRR
jgi:LruC domain-containing protein